MKPITPLAVLVLLAGPAFADTWRCQVPYDEVNGGGHVILEEDRMVFVSDWPHRDREIVKCIRAGLTSECMSADLATNRDGGASIFAKLYSIVWQKDGRPPTTITTRQISAIFKDHVDGYAMAEAFPAIGHTFPVTDCKPD
ncbi:hypothetical protein ACROSR_18445 [Roseovarius tibetensis]|uniref:hypothetical protein n=1 Tax=Roseovarius tibetensis TaxID=2685897 RepID=UPI003D7FD98D